MPKIIFSTQARTLPTVTIFLVVTFVGCTQQQQTPQAIRQETARATAEAKSDVKAVAEGVREGWDRNKPLNLNSATREELLSLDGVNATEADRMIAGRPYAAPRDLVTRHIISEKEYERIAVRITAKQESWGKPSPYRLNG